MWLLSTKGEYRRRALAGKITSECSAMQLMTTLYCKYSQFRASTMQPMGPDKNIVTTLKNSMVEDITRNPSRLPPHNFVVRAFAVLCGRWLYGAVFVSEQPALTSGKTIRRVYFARARTHARTDTQAHTLVLRYSQR